MKKLLTFLFLAGWLIYNSAFATIYLVENGSGTNTWRTAGAGEVNVVLSGTSLNAWYTTATIAVGDQVWIKNGTYVLDGSITPKGGESIYGGFAGTETAISQRAKGTNAWDFTNETVLDGNNLYIVLNGANSTANLTTIGGLTLTKGFNDATNNYGAGARLNANTIMQNCIISYCTTTTTTVGGVYVNTGASLVNSYIHHNESTTSSAGGIYAIIGTSIIGCLVDNNTAYLNAGGIYIFQGASGVTDGVTISNCTVTNNKSTTSNGGGISSWQSAQLTAPINIINCIISNNSSNAGQGGGIFIAESSLMNTYNVTGCTISNNSSTAGGGLYLKLGKLIASNNNFLSNTTTGGGAGINLLAGTATINNSIIKNNSSPDGTNVGSAIHATMGFTANNVVTNANKGKFSLVITTPVSVYSKLNNCTFANSQLSTGTTVNYSRLATVESTVFTNCLAYNCGANPYYKASDASATITNCGIDASCTLANFNAYTDRTGSFRTLTSSDFKDAANGDFRLSSTSIAKDAGTTIAATSSDILGVTRPKGPKYDMGAYEYCNEWVGSGNWNNTANWSAGALPTSTDGVLVKSGSMIIDQVATINDISINPTATLTNNSTLNTTYLNLKSDATGTGTYVDNGTTNIAGSVKVQQYLTGAGSATPNNRFWYISSPVSAATSAVLDAAGTNKLWSYSESAHAYTEIVDNATTLAVTKGYAARLGANITAEFTGAALNNGDYTINLTRAEDTNDKRGYNLVGNPYPSFLDWELVTKSSAVLPTIWTRSFNGSAMGFDTYNGALHSGVSANGNSVSKYIAPMQAFWVKVDAGNTTGTISLANTMRSVVDQTQGTNKLKAPAISNQKIIRLQVSNGINSDETLIAFNENASNAFDKYDSPKMSNSNVAIPELFTSIGGEQLAINGRNSFVNNEELPLGFTAGEANNYSITASQIDNFDSNTSILLKDNLLDTELELNNGTVYNFNSDATVASTRFSVFFKSKSINTDLINTTNIKFNVFKSANNEIIVQHNMNGSEGVIDVFNFVGQKIMNMPCSGNITKITHSFNPGVYLLSVTVAGQAQTQKIIIN